jgi:hypothetical protein
MSKNYCVEFTIHVDHPEKRCSSFPVVEAGTKIHNQWCYDRQSDAVRMFESILLGNWDYSSEFMEKVRVIQFRHDQSPRIVRKTVNRTR